MFHFRWGEVSPTPSVDGQIQVHSHSLNIQTLAPQCYIFVAVGLITHAALPPLNNWHQVSLGQRC